MEIDNKNLRKGIQLGLGSQSIFVPELEEVLFEKIKKQLLIENYIIDSVCYGCDECGKIFNSKNLFSKHYCT